MNWIGLLERVEPYYRWRREKHPPYPDLLLEWGLYAQLRALLSEEREAGAGEPWFDAAAEARDNLAAAGADFEDLAAWEAWLDAQGGLRAPAPAPAADVLSARLREDLAAADAERDALLAATAPLDAAPAALRRALLCPAFRRPLAAMAEFFTYRDEGETGRRLYAWAALCGRSPERHWLYLSKWERRLGSRDAAVRALETGLARWPESVLLLRALADARDREGDVDAAVALLERAVAVQPAWPDLRYELGRLLAEGEHRERSLLEMGRALELNPGYTRAALGRAELLMALGEDARAERQLESLRRDQAEPSRVYELLSRIYAERSDSRRAEEFSVLAQRALADENEGSRTGA